MGRAVVVAFVLAGLVSCCAGLPARAAPDVDKHISCDVMIAGGSTAALAAAITAAEAAPHLTVCVTEITDWFGGQMTAGGVPAIDFGGSNRNVDNQPKSFRDFFNHYDGNPGACSVSLKCYPPNDLVESWINPRIANSSNLLPFRNTAVINTTRDADGRITSITAVQRTVRPNATAWATRLSDEIEDWYTPTDSATFTKTVLEFTAVVFVEATELGDVLVTGELPLAQGTEAPDEMSHEFLETCGQAWTLTFYMTRLGGASPKPDPFPKGDTCGGGSPDVQAFDWRHSWSWRRALCGGNTSLQAVNVGDITQQNLFNDLRTAYAFPPLEDVYQQRDSGWKGGLNLTAIRMMEDRAYWYYQYMRNASMLKTGVPSSHFTLDTKTSGTLHGLSKFPYVRGTRRTLGLDGFRLTYPPFDYYNESAPVFGFRFNDTVALGNYNMDWHRLSNCQLPNYTSIHTTKPYYIPFRALTAQNAPNLLVTGKTMAQTIHANGATRLHPSEWTTGVAAGGIAALMIERNWLSTAEAYQHIGEVQAFLNSSLVGQPLDWVPSDVHPPIGYMCGIDRCFTVDTHFPGHVLYPNSTCDSNCAPLKHNEWLANKAYWTVEGSSIRASQDTVLKKSEAHSNALPNDQKKTVVEGFTCQLVTTKSIFGYWLCTV